MTNQTIREKHRRDVLVTECWPMSCLEGDCDHRDEDGEPRYTTVCPPTRYKPLDSNSSLEVKKSAKGEKSTAPEVGQKN